MRKVLTPDLISAKTRCDNLLLIKNLNLWGNDIEDIKLLRQMPNLEILSLSVNRISSLKEFANCKKLQELYLRKNNITDLEELRYLIDLQDLRILWLLDNPCSEQENYREIVINALPNIKKLDNNDVSNEERKLAEVIKRPINKNTDFGSNQQVKAMDYVSNNQQGKIIDSPKVIKTRASLYEEKPAAAIVKPRNVNYFKFEFL